MRRSIAVPAFLGLVLAACGAPPADEPLEIVLASNRLQTLDLFMMSVPGDSLLALTAGQESAYSPGWHPGGNRIAYATRTDSTTAILTLEVRTGETDTLISGPDYYGEPEWAPDGQSVVFVSSRDHPPLPMGSDRELYRMGADGTGLERLTDDTVYQGAPRFSPDGSRLAFCELVPSEGGDPVAAVMVGDASANGAHAITDGAGFDCLPTWSPDGDRLAFHRCGGGTCEIWTVAEDGSGARAIRTGAEAAQWPAWSPDGEWIAFTLTRGGQTDIYRIRPDGTGEEQVTFTPSREEAAEWRPLR